jgi:hypothetical protein
MSSTPHWAVYRESAVLASTPLDDGNLCVAPGTIAEGDRLNMRLAQRESGQEYQIRIGNLPPDAPQGFDPGRDPAMGYDLGHEIVWPAAAYLESARGPTVIELRSRNAEEADTWRTRARVEFAVRPSKLGEARYQAMFNDLRALSAGLVFDLVSKSSRAYSFIHSVGQVHTGSRQMELRAIEQTWRRLLPLLHEISEQPAVRLVRRKELRRCWGGERMHRSASRYLTAHGVAPYSAAVPRPFTAPVETLSESYDTPEHSVIAGFLDLLLLRADACGRSAYAQLRTLKGSARLAPDQEPRGWLRIDRPRVDRLVEITQTIENIQRQIRRVRAWSLFKHAAPALQPLRTPVFDNVAVYARVRGEIVSFLNRAGVVLDEGEGDLIKPTWRMYEQWVLIQCLAALRATGLRSEPAEQLIRKVGRSRFTLDFERGTEFLFHSHDGRVIRVRYEPWIVTRGDAIKVGESVYRSGGSSEWSPDILIEVLLPSSSTGRVPEVEYAVVIDAKYSEHLREERWESTRKYFEIHGTVRRRPVVRQVWLAFPGVDERILPRDPTVRWNLDGPDLGLDENLHGALELLPDPERIAGDDTFASIQPLPVIRSFIDGLLSFLDFAEGIPELRAVTNATAA